jgi:hypothetical protein
MVYDGLRWSIGILSRAFGQGQGSERVTRGDKPITRGDKRPMLLCYRTGGIRGRRRFAG